MQAYRCDGMIETPDHIRLVQKLSLPTGSKVEVIILEEDNSISEITTQVKEIEEWLMACDDFSNSIRKQSNVIVDLSEIRQELSDK